VARNAGAVSAGLGPGASGPGKAGDHPEPVCEPYRRHRRGSERRDQEDDALVLTGSYNWTESASEKNIELIIGVEHQDIVGRFAELFATLWDSSPPAHN
jgi:PLD-like domain